MLRFFRLTILGLALLIIPFTYASHIKTFGETIGDSVITTKITAKFTKNTLLNPFKIIVSTNHGVVTLRGNVNDKHAYREAINLVKATKGVISVNTKALHIQPVNTIFTDSYITAKVEASILKAKLMEDESIPIVGINATTTNGIVILSGEVKQKRSIAIILKYASAVKGVRRINASKLRVSKAVS